MKLTEKILVFTAVLIILSFFAGCGATATKAVKQEEKRPEWIDNYPVDPAYFVGIGSAKTGNKPEDLETAKAKALTALASAISVNISSTQEFTVKEDSKGGAYQSAELQISQSVNRNFRDIEVFDSYYSDQSGYWFYYRISRARWAEIERQEKAELIARVNSITAPALESATSSDFEILSSLAKAWEVVAESPYEGSLRATLGGRDGLLIDNIEGLISDVFSNLDIAIEPVNISTEPGRQESIKIKVKDKRGREPGQFRIDFLNKADSSRVAEVTTEKDGSFSGKTGFAGLPVGKNQAAAVISMPYLGIRAESMRKKISPPEKDLSVTVNQVSVVLKLVISGDADIPSLPDSVRALFSRKELSLRLSSAGDEKHTIVFSMYFRNMPENTHGLFITNAKAVISLQKEGSNIYTYETKEYREAGLSWNQAQERAVIKLFRDLNNDAAFLQDLHKSVYAGLSLD